MCRALSCASHCTQLSETLPLLRHPHSKARLRCPARNVEEATMSSQCAPRVVATKPAVRPPAGLTRAKELHSREMVARASPTSHAWSSAMGLLAGMLLGVMVAGMLRGLARIGCASRKLRSQRRTMRPLLVGTTRCIVGARVRVTLVRASSTTHPPTRGTC